MQWLLEESVFHDLQAVVQAGKMPSAEQQVEYEASVREGGSGVLAISGGKARISISGVLTRRPSFFAMLFGGGNTTYADIVSALAQANADDRVTGITLAIDSPGGEFAGLFDVLDAVKASAKPVTAVVGSMAASAAYAIASQAGQIVASGRASQVGSIGVVASFYVNDNIVDITSSEAPNKRPDVRTEQGRAMVREHLDELHQIFVDAISAGRNIPAKTVNTTFGRGAVLLAESAMGRGMIDAISGVGSGPQGKDKTEEKMDINTLKSEHPDLYAQVRTVGFDAGVKEERDRVTAHLIMGEKSGAMDTAVKAVREGSVMTMTLQAEYMTAGMNRADIQKRVDDDKAVANVANGAAPLSEDAIVDATLKLLESGKETEAHNG